MGEESIEFRNLLGNEIDEIFDLQLNDEYKNKVLQIFDSEFAKKGKHKYDWSRYKISVLRDILNLVYMAWEEQIDDEEQEEIKLIEELDTIKNYSPGIKRAKLKALKEKFIIKKDDMKRYKYDNEKERIKFIELSQMEFNTRKSKPDSLSDDEIFQYVSREKPGRKRVLQKIERLFDDDWENDRYRAIYISDNEIDTPKGPVKRIKPKKKL